MWSDSTRCSNYLRKIATDPRFIETHRLSPFPKRSTDIGVVLDLMIHAVWTSCFAFVKSPVTSVDAMGIAGIEQDGGRRRMCGYDLPMDAWQNMTASRIAPERMRKIRVFLGGATTCYVSLDYRAQEGYIYRIACDGEEGKLHLEKKSFAAKLGVSKRYRPSSANLAASALCGSRFCD